MKSKLLLLMPCIAFLCLPSCAVTSGEAVAKIKAAAYEKINSLTDEQKLEYANKAVDALKKITVVTPEAETPVE